MEDFLLGLLGIIFEVLVDSVDEIAFAAIVAAGNRLARRFRVTARRGSPVLATAILITVGVLLGLLSTLIFPHPLLHASKHHGISLLVSPVITGLAMALIGRSVRRRGRVPVQIESFGYGFAFAFAMALIRFLQVN
jgi:4-amino-4-deoxy-L-arabinose transferase-like glycosyltransferase